MRDPAQAQREEAFWDLADDLCADPAVQRSTMMGFPCLRVEGAFFASIEKDSKHLIVKLSAERIDALVDAGKGSRFAPNGRVFREWIVISELDRSEWQSLMAEAKEFVR